METTPSSINLTNSTNFTSCVKAVPPIFESFDDVMVALYLIVISISTPGNILLIFVVSRNPSMQTFTNCLICNCAVADLLSTLVPGILNVIDTLSSHSHAWIFGEFVCKFLYICIYWSVSVTIISLTIIAVDRYLVIIFSHMKYFTTKMLRYVVPTIWVLGFAFASPSIFIMQLVRQNGVEVCLEQWPPPFDPVESPKHYTIVLFVCLYLIPLVLMTKIYMSIAKKMSGFTGRNNSYSINRVNHTKTLESHSQNSHATATELSTIELSENNNKPNVSFLVETPLSEDEKKEPRHQYLQVQGTACSSKINIERGENHIKPNRQMSLVRTSLSENENKEGHQYLHVQGIPGTDESSIENSGNSVDGTVSTVLPALTLASIGATASTSLIETSLREKRKKRGHRKQRVITMLIAIVTCFAICWLPVFMLQFVMYFYPYYVKCPDAMPSWAYVVAFFMHYCNSAVTPLLYFGFSYSYRRGFRDSFIRRSKQGFR